MELSLFEQEGTEEDGTFCMDQIEDSERLKKVRKLMAQLNPQTLRKKAIRSSAALASEHIFIPLAFAL